MATGKASSNGTRVSPGKPDKAPVKVFPPLPPVEEDTDREDDFLKFWAEFRAGEAQKTTRILGIDVAVPSDLPLSFDDVQTRLAASKADVESDEAQALFAEMVSVLFGEEIYAAWKQRGLTSLMLRVLVTWGLMNANGTETTFAEAGEVVKQQIADEAAGKPQGPNRATRRAAAKKPASSRTQGSGTTGQPSKQISPASTRSRRTS